MVLQGLPKFFKISKHFHLLLSHIWLPTALGSGSSALWVTQAAGYVGSDFVSLFWGGARGLESDFVSGKVVVCLCAGCGVCIAWGIKSCVRSLLCCLWVSLGQEVSI